MPRVSILLPAYQAAATLDAALRSVARQSFDDWECIVVDDGSTDGTAAIATAAARRDSRFRPVSVAHAGIVTALTEGARRACGEFVARMDADDLMHRERLAAQLAACRADPILSGVGCRVRLFPRTRLTAGLRAYERWLNAITSAEDVAREAFVECPIAHPTLFLRRSVLERFGYRDTGWPEDYDLVLRLLAGGERLAVVPRRLMSWRDHAGRASRSSAHCSIEAFVRCKAAHLAAGFLAADDGYVLWGFGATGRALRRALAGHGRSPSHIIEVHPRLLGERIHGAPVIPPERLGELPRRPIVVSVAGDRPRAQIRAFLDAMSLREMTDYVCAA